MAKKKYKCKSKILYVIRYDQISGFIEDSDSTNQCEEDCRIESSFIPHGCLKNATFQEWEEDNGRG